MGKECSFDKPSSALAHNLKKPNVLALKVFSKAFLFSLKAAVISPEETKRLLVTILRREGVRKRNCP